MNIEPRSRADSRGDPVLRGLRVVQEPGQEDGADVQAVQRAAQPAGPLRLWLAICLFLYKKMLHTLKNYLNCFFPVKKSCDVNMWLLKIPYM